MTFNPSRNTLPLANNTKSIDLERLKNTQHSLVIQQQKYRRLRKGLHLIKVQLKIIKLQSYFTLTRKSKVWCESWKLEIKMCQIEFLKSVSYPSETYNKLFIFSKDWLKHLMKERIQLENILDRFTIQNWIL